VITGSFIPVLPRVRYVYVLSPLEEISVLPGDFGSFEERKKNAPKPVVVVFKNSLLAISFLDISVPPLLGELSGFPGP
jgi:hypothetical protein